MILPPFFEHDKRLGDKAHRILKSVRTYEQAQVAKRWLSLARRRANTDSFLAYADRLDDLLDEYFTATFAPPRNKK